MSGEDDRNSFARGMTIGAIIGAIVAGSSLWSRRRRNRRAALQLAPGDDGKGTLDMPDAKGSATAAPRRDPDSAAAEPDRH